jgi:hypothetical protein
VFATIKAELAATTSHEWRLLASLVVPYGAALVVAVHTIASLLP